SDDLWCNRIFISKRVTEVFLLRKNNQFANSIQRTTPLFTLTAGHRTQLKLFKIRRKPQPSEPAFVFTMNKN
ncbi:MAG: hypothetical protein K2G01_09515, partial [Paramuribaculum sp.]|nr:hypothetical protein [Paramuribaculum sp.]